MKDLPVRQSIRLKDYNYSSNGMYFITVCVKDRHELLGKIVGDAHPGVPRADPRVELNETGNMVKRYIENISDHYDNVKIHKYVVMPNHVHMIVFISCEISKCEARDAQCASPTKSLLAKTINAFKSLTSRQFGEPMWQRSYHDHIIRDEEDYLTHWQYIDENPAKWAEDEYYGEAHE